MPSSFPTATPAVPTGSASRSGGGTPEVLVLGGGPDAERQVSLTSAKFVADAIDASGKYRSNRQTIDTVTGAELRAMPGDAIFPVLHGGWGEGGQLQDLLERDGRPFVGCGARAARLAMDKIATKAAALKVGIPTPEARVLDLRDPTPPMPFPLIVKPIHEGSTIGLYVINTRGEWDTAQERIRAEQRQAAMAGNPTRSYMVEPRVAGRELTVGVLDGEPLPVIEIVPAAGLYDYEAKYTRSDTQYNLDPELPRGSTDAVKAHAVRLAYAIGVRHLARVDFILDSKGVAWMLEINTMPGFTDHSLVPMAARHAGMPMPVLCAGLVEMAVRDQATARA